MMTVAEAEMMRRVAEKGRSASFCAPGQPHFAMSSAHSSQEISNNMTARAQAQAFSQLTEREQEALHPSNQSPRTRLKVSGTARRSQSCRVSGSRPPRSKRLESPRDSGHNLNDSGREEIFIQEHLASREGSSSRRNSTSYSMKKVPSCGRLVTLSAEDSDDIQGSPILRRTASARRALPPTSSPNHSPTPTRGLRPGTQKSRPSPRRNTPTHGSTKRPQGSGYLDVKASSSAETLDPDAYLLRNFSTTHKGIINRGDSFRRRRSRSNSIQPPGDGSFSTTPTTSSFQMAYEGASQQAPAAEQPSQGTSDDEPAGETTTFRIAIIGATGVGKTALINQFQTSECINAFDCCSAEDGEQTTAISIVLNNQESELVFINVATPSDFTELLKQPNPADGWMVVYSITDKASFQKANEELTKLQAGGQLRGKAVIVVANKCELVRSRNVSAEDGRDLAVSFGGKFMEISVGMNHKCDDLLVGTLRQLRLKQQACCSGEESTKENVPWTKNRSLMRASIKAKRVMNKIMGKSDSKLKNSEDFSCL